MFGRKARNEVHETFKALKFVFTAPLILGFLFLVNWMTSPGHWWVQWAAFGIGIGWFFSLLRVLKALVIAGGLAAFAAYLSKARAS